MILWITQITKLKNKNHIAIIFHFIKCHDDQNKQSLCIFLAFPASSNVENAIADGFKDLSSLPKIAKQQIVLLHSFSNIKLTTKTK